MLFVAGVAFLSGLIFAAGLKGGTPENLKEKPGFKHLMATAIQSMRNPRISLAFAATFLARADVSVNGIFISLWAVTSAVDLGITTGEAFKQIVPLIVITNLLSIVWAFLFGSIIDRINRVTAMVIAMALGVIAYGSIVFVDTPLNFSYLPIFIIISASAIGTVIATASLIGQEAPVRERGSVIGVSGFFGACGILVATSIGGLLFDSFGPKGPFLLICFTHAVILFGAVFVRIKSPGEYFGANKETI
tara:strand:- start:187 stop:930 length:744 start_codon:yes stop_codon:yes gene_type:complete